MEPNNAAEKLSRDEAVAYAARMHDAWTVAKDSIAKAQARYKASADKHRREVNFTINDYIFATSRNWHSDRPSRKLN